MNILCLHPYLSMRAVKEMAALKEKGHRVYLAFEGLGSSVENGYGTFWDQIIKLPSDTFKGEYYCRRLFPITYKKVLTQTVKNSNFDLIHTFGMPDTLAVAAIRYSGLPVVFDSRDLSSGMDHFLMDDLKNSFLNKLQELIYKRVIKKYEKEANEKSNGRVYSSPEMLSYVDREYKIDQNRSIVLANYQCNDYVPKAKLPKLSSVDCGTHLVYSGNICFDGLKRSKKLFQDLISNSIHLHIYPTGDKAIINNFKNKFLNNCFVHFHRPLSPGELSREIQKYDYGFIPCPPDQNVLNRNLILPNKLFDYLVAGLPIAGRNTNSLTNFIKKHKVGFIYDTNKELVEKLRNCKKNYEIYPERFIMENHIVKVSNLYISISKG